MKGAFPSQRPALYAKAPPQQLVTYNVFKHILVVKTFVDLRSMVSLGCVKGKSRHG